MTAQDIVLLSLTMWRENRGGGTQGMQSVGNVIINRMARSGADAYTICTSHAQFSSVSMPGPESYLWGKDADPQWQEALALAAQAAAGTLEDITQGATSYYASSMATPPGWASFMQHTVTIEGQLFFRLEAS